MDTGICIALAVYLGTIGYFVTVHVLDTRGHLNLWTVASSLVAWPLALIVSLCTPRKATW
jgi:hypothetical protein